MTNDLGLANFRRLINQALDAIPAGLHAASDLIEVAASDGARDTIIGMSGATFASIIAYVASQDDDGTAEIVAAFNAAAGRLTGFTGHDGQAHLGDVSGPPNGQAWIVLTVPTDYIDRILFERNDFLGDAGLATAPAAFGALITALRGAWRL